MSAAALRCDVQETAPAPRRFYDAASAAWLVKVFPGECYCTSSADEVLVTVLGSCVAACIRDPGAGIGGMNHFMLPHGRADGWGDDAQAARFGNFAMEKLINELIKAGAARAALEIKVFGGGNVTDGRHRIGTGNADFVLRYLAEEGLRCVAHDLGGNLPRRIHYSPLTGRVVRRLLATGATPTVAGEELTYARTLAARRPGEVELFGNAGVTP